MSLRRSSIVIFWACLELNILRFLPLISIGGNLALENTIKYFLIQSIASVFFLLSAIIISHNPYRFINISILLAIILKLGASPIHGWFISLIKNSRPRVIFYLSTSQKFIPLVILTNLYIRRILFTLIILTTMVVVFINGISILALNKILGISSINNLIWIIIGSQVRSILMIMFFSVYTILLLRVLTITIKIKGALAAGQVARINIRSKLIFRFFFLSLGGLPPFLGFLGKVIILKHVIIWFDNILLIMLTLSSLIILLYYVIFRIFRLAFIPNTKIVTATEAPEVSNKLFFISLLGFNLLALNGM